VHVLVDTVFIWRQHQSDRAHSEISPLRHKTRWPSFWWNILLQTAYLTVLVMKNRCTFKKSLWENIDLCWFWSRSKSELSQNGGPWWFPILIIKGSLLFSYWFSIENHHGPPFWEALTLTCCKMNTNQYFPTNFFLKLIYFSWLKTWEKQFAAVYFTRTKAIGFCVARAIFHCVFYPLGSVFMSAAAARALIVQKPDYLFR